MTPNVEPARDSDLEAIRHLLGSTHLPTDGLSDQFPGAYVVSRLGAEVVGAAGLEQHGCDGLLRSVAVAGDHRRRGLGRALIVSRIEAARLAQLKSIYVLTTTATEVFVEMGFVETDRASVPAEMAASREFRETCPSTATCLVFPLE